ncbi:MAG: phospho-N-acetylmuramoyl-pentapeptide-transferase [Clostridia bacterium]|nr:phospho-N-acetylmuramoyl-pentapeptide-transferase [Clostridia bacterium]
MTPVIRLPLYFIGSFFMSVLIAPLIIKGLKKLRAGQSILEYVVQHESKSGTPTMGGIIFIIPIVIVSLIEFTPLSLVAMSLTLGFGLVGFLDDFIKVKLGRNQGLKPYQKIVAQLGLSAIASYFAYASDHVGTVVNIPFLSGGLDLGWGIIPLVLFLYVATTNAVNLTDGLDGLAGLSSVGYFVVFAILIVVECSKLGDDNETTKQLMSLCAFSVATIGGLLGYLVYNSYPAKVFMGDTGSLALGASVASVAVMSKNPLFISTAGIMFVWTCISVIIQVLYFKLTKKRVFLMAPFHHHLEMKGMSETKIGVLYLALTLVGGAVTFVLAGGI